MKKKKLQDIRPSNSLPKKVKKKKVDKAPKEKKGKSGETSVSKSRSDWEYNQNVIEETIAHLMKENPDRRISMTLIAKNCFLSYNTIYRHGTGFKLAKFVGAENLKTPKMLHALYLKGMGGSVRAMELWLKAIAGWSDKFILENRNTYDYRIEVNKVKASQGTPEWGGRLRQFFVSDNNSRKSSDSSGHNR